MKDIDISQKIINIDGVPKKVGRTSIFWSMFFLNLFCGVFSFFFSYWKAASITSMMGTISGFGAWLFFLGIVLVIFQLVSKLELSLFLGGVILGIFGMTFTINGCIKFLMAKKFAKTFSSLE